MLSGGCPTLSDDEFMRAFESATLPADHFDHIAHVRAGWCYLQRYPLGESLDRFSRALRAFATANGATRKYHETMTVTWMLLIAERLSASRELDWPSFAVRHPELFAKPSLLAQYYSGATLDSEHARSSFLMPDLLERSSNTDLGPPALKIAGFQLWVHGRQFPDAHDADDGNWLSVTGHCGASGASVWIQGALVMVSDIAGFGLECQRMYDGATDRATMEPFEPELRLRLEAIDGLGHIRAHVEITPDHLAQNHHMQFEIDQSYLPEIVAQCAAILRTYPVRGRSGPAET